MTGILTLPTELLIYVAEMLQRYELSRLQCTCRHLRNIITPILYRKLNLENEVQLTFFFRAIINNSTLIDHVRGIVLTIKIDAEGYKEPAFFNIDRKEEERRKTRFIESTLRGIWREMSSLSARLGGTQFLSDRVASGNRLFHGILLLMTCRNVESVWMDTDSITAFPAFLVEVLSNGNFLPNLRRYEHPYYDQDLSGLGVPACPKLLEIPVSISSESMSPVSYNMRPKLIQFNESFPPGEYLRSKRKLPNYNDLNPQN